MDNSGDGDIIQSFLYLVVSLHRLVDSFLNKFPPVVVALKSLYEK